MSGITAWFQQLQPEKLISTLLVVAASLLCITVHETCHGLVAWWLGDPTAKNAGRLTLNPIKHVDVAGLVMMAILKFGWAKPVPVNMGYFKNPKGGMALTAAAGPVSNILLAIAALLLRSVLIFFAVLHENALLLTALEFTEYVAVISAGLAVFNLIPISPLDGSKVLLAFLPQDAYRWVMRYERYGMLVLIVVMFAGWLDTPLLYLRGGLLAGLQEITWFPFELLSKTL